jgi:sulfatase maturation enzyme AslB (radical SAM superfamily)
VTRFTCDWIFNILVVLCDGKVVCGCADPLGERPLGHLKQNSLDEIWQSQKVRRIREELNSGFSDFCLPCGIKKALREDEPVPQRPLQVDILPRIFFEPSIVCNLNCFQSVCAPGTGIAATRERKFFPADDFRSLLEAIGAKLIRLDFFNYGEPFIHPQALEMIEYVKKKYPHIYLYTSTNGLLLDDKKISRLAESGIDEITFSVDGADQRTYARYRRGGDLAKLLKNMAALVREKKRLGREVPFINWRYILFKWNDSAWQLGKARRLAKKIGVDRLTWEITDHPASAASKKYKIGAPAWRQIYHEIWDSSQIGSALRSNKYIAVIKLSQSRLAVRAEQKIQFAVQVKNRGGALWITQTFSGRRLVRLGAQLYTSEKKLLDLNYARAFLPRPMAKGNKADVMIELPAINDCGEYWLKFDMVSEGVDWFENGGSPIVWLPLKVT